MTLQSRAARVFAIEGAYLLVIVAFALGGAATVPALVLSRTVTFLVVAALLIAAFFEARGLARHRAWAVAAAVPMLWILISFDLAGVALALTEGRVAPPVGTALGVWALRGGSGAPLASGGTAARALVGAYLALSVVGIAMVPALPPGGPLDVGYLDLHSTLSVDCPTGPDASQPIAATFGWTWDRTMLVPEGDDAVVIGWTGTGAGADGEYVLGDVASTGDGIESGSSGPMSGEMAQGLQHVQPSWTWGVFLSRQRQEPGEVRMTLRPAASPRPEHAYILVQAQYIHLGTWRSLPVEMGCQW